jgi:hypothetical protein
MTLLCQSLPIEIVKRGIDPIRINLRLAHRRAGEYPRSRCKAAVRGPPCKACRVGHKAHFIRTRIARGTEVYADEGSAWNELHRRFTMHRINHQEAYSLGDGLHSNNAESFFSRMRRAQIGHHHHLAGPYLIRFAQEASWREDHRRDPNGVQVDLVVALAMRNKPSGDFCGYWQRSRIS